MLVVLIPSLLVAKLYGDLTTWEYGAESSYSAIVEVATEIGGAGIHGINATFPLKCRQKGTWTIACTASEAMLVIAGHHTHFRNEEPSYFEIHFDESGVKWLRVARDIRKPTLNMFRRFAAQMNVGALARQKIAAKETESFDGTETTLLGNCQTNFSVAGGLYTVSPVSGHNFDLLVMPTMTVANFSLERTRDPQTCDEVEKYAESAKRENGAKVIDYTTNTYITESGFYKSRTMIRTRTPSQVYHIEEITTLELQGIEKATEPLPVRPESMMKTVDFTINQFSNEVEAA